MGCGAEYVITQPVVVLALEFDKSTETCAILHIPARQFTCREPPRYLLPFLQAKKSGSHIARRRPARKYRGRKVTTLFANAEPPRCKTWGRAFKMGQWWNGKHSGLQNRLPSEELWVRLPPGPPLITEHLVETCSTLCYKPPSQSKPIINARQ
jgi:hypothetical protein